MATFRTRTGRHGDITVTCMVRLAGYPTRTETFKSKREAAKWAATVEAEMIEGRHYKDALGRKRTLADAIERYRREVLPMKKNGSMYGFTLDWWEANHNTKKLGEITRGWLSGCRAELLTGTFRRATPGSKRSAFKVPTIAGHPAPSLPPGTMIRGSFYDHAQDYTQPQAYVRTPATANRYMAALSSVFSHVCGDWEWLRPHDNPFTGLAKLPEGRNKGRAYSPEAIARLLQEARQEPQLYTLVQVALGTAARAGELLGLTWACVEFVAGRPVDTSGPGGGGGGGYEPDCARLLFTDTKNGEARLAWLFGDALEALKDHQLRTHAMIADPLARMHKPVFPGQWSHKDGKYGRYDYLPRLHEALKRAGLDMPRPFHALRHTAATNMARTGANAHQLKALGGWKSDAVNRYVHMAAEDTKGLAQEYAKRLQGPAK